MKKLVLIGMLMCCAYMVFQTSCANIGMPSGGPKDSIAPSVIKIEPLPNQTNYHKQSMTITFDEYVISTDVPSKMLVSPPIRKKADVKMRSKTLMINFKDQLKENKTYSIDFRGSIKDNNEGNPIEDFRLAFSTGNILDSLEIGGYVQVAENLLPAEDILITLYSVDSLHYFKDSIPDYIAMTDSAGFFLISNIADGKYRMYAVKDEDNSLTYNSGGELIAFIDTLVSPQAPIRHTHNHNDSITIDSLDIDAKGTLGDLIKISENKINEEHEEEHKHEGTPTPYYLMLYKEKTLDQYLNTYKREYNNLCRFIFDNTLTDSFKIDLIKPKIIDNTDWVALEYSHNRDSVTAWITDTTITKCDTLVMSLNYTVLDSMKMPISKIDTLKLTFTTPKETKKKKKNDDKNEVLEIPHFTFKTNNSAKLDIYKKLEITTPEPLREVNFSAFHLYHAINDSVKTPVEFNIKKDSTNLCKYIVDYKWEFEKAYKFEIDSAAAKSIGGLPSRPLIETISIQNEDYYAKITLDVSDVKFPSIIQILANNKTESLIQQKSITNDCSIEFPLLNPEKVIIRVIIDSNENGKWDVGDIEKNILPERIAYYPKVIKLRSNFEVQEKWQLPKEMSKKKELIDDDDENKKNKTTK